MTEDTTIDLDSYFARIGYDGPRAPTLDTLKALHYAHALSIPFENLDVLAKRPVNLDLPSLQRKLVTEKRGGYCFEVNALFAAVLGELGFDVTTLIGRVRWMAPENADTARSHMLMRVELPEGPFVADVGFGGLTMTGPIRFETGIEQQTPHEPRRLLTHEDGFELQAKIAGEWTPIYRFTLEPHRRSDYEVASWYTSTHPGSIFVQFLMAGLPREGQWLSLFNCDFKIRSLDGKAEARKLESVDEIADVLGTYFGIPLAEEDKALALAPYFEQWRAMG
ncbi:MAG: arylamine N-acetyltransferase [Parvibaculum sp.]|uniref:arylamine N-acetyltransferase family protein n=1 Tax=Parvibaculum sp. TaxID=2024848 RepID=UPI00271F8456|nr:arylamine N-acetyltransferase [Parvibaculum sp.]MDO8837748.1 arylamine N-acetyltransferase [Parvibaculum sp.]